MSLAARDHLWHEVWAEYDARNPRPRPATVPAPAARPARRAGIGWRRAATGLGLLLAAGYLVPPVMAALHTAEGLRQGGPLPLADAASLAPSLQREMMASDVLGGLGADAPSFVQDMARSVSEALAAPAPLADALRRRLPGGDAALTGLRPLGWRSWQAQYGADGVRVTLTLADPLSLRWEVASVALPLPRRSFDW